MEEQEQTQKNSRTVLQENAKNAEKSQIVFKSKSSPLQVSSSLLHLLCCYYAALQLIPDLHRNFI